MRVERDHVPRQAHNLSHLPDGDVECVLCSSTFVYPTVLIQASALRTHAHVSRYSIMDAVTDSETKMNMTATMPSLSRKVRRSSTTC